MFKTPKELQHEILNGNVVKAAFLLGWPMMVTSLMQSGYNLADMFWVGHLPEGESMVAIAAMNVAWPLIFIFMSLAMGFGSAGTSLVSQYTGAGNKRMVDRVSGQMVFSSLAVSITMAVVGIAFVDDIIRFIGVAPNVTEMAIAYTEIIFISLPFMFMSIVFTMILRGWGNTVTPMWMNGATLILNIVLDPIMIFGWGGFPKMGIVGAAIATLISRMIYAGLALYWLHAGKAEIKVGREEVRPDRGLIKKILRIGAPMSLAMTFTAIGFFIMMLIIAGLPGQTYPPNGGEPVPNSTIAMAAYGIGNRMINLTFIIVDGLAFSLTTIVGQNIGAGKMERARESYWKIAGISFGILWGFSAVFLLFAEQILSFFTSDPLVIESGVVFMSIIALGMPFFSIFRSSIGYFNGTGRTEFNLVMSLLRLWVMRLPMCYFFSMMLGAAGIWYGMAISNMTSAAVGLLMVFFVKIDSSMIEKRKRRMGPMKM